MKNFNYDKQNILRDEKQVKKLLKKFDQIFENNLYRCHTPGIRELKGDEILKEPLFVSLLDEVHKQFELILGKKDLNFEKLWLVSSTSSDVDEHQLPFIPHIDKDRSLKAMVYLHNVSFDHGPIHLGVAKNTITIEKRRRELPKDYQSKGLNTIDEKDIDGDLAPMIGKAGDVIFFDTNAPHKAGILKKGYYRKVLRFKFKRPSFNPRPFILNRIINRIKRAI